MKVYLVYEYENDERTYPYAAAVCATEKEAQLVCESLEKVSAKRSVFHYTINEVIGAE